MQKINWQQYFSKTIIDRGRSYYKNGKVRNLRKQGDKYYAKVQGSYPYEVAIWKKANNQLGMSCDCMYATDGNYCKHMAAVCMKIEEEFGAEERKQIVPQAAKNPEVQVKPFKKKNVKGAKEYTCFDLSRMTEDIKIMDSQWKAAQKLVEKNMMKLQTVREGYMNNGYGESVPAGAVTAYYEEAGRTSQINIRFSSRKILEAVCRVPNCNYIHYDYSYSTKEKLCKHQLAVLQLLENYIEEYNPGDTTDVRALDFIEHYQKKQRSQALAKADAEVRDLQIDPRIEWTENGLVCSYDVTVDSTVAGSIASALFEEGDVLVSVAVNGDTPLQLTDSHQLHDIFLKIKEGDSLVFKYKRAASDKTETSFTVSSYYMKKD